MVIGKEKYLTVEITKTGTKKVQFLSIKYEEVSAKISDILKKSHMINEIFQPHGSLYQLRKHPSKTDLGFHGWYRIEFCCPGLMAVVYSSDLCSTFRRHLCATSIGVFLPPQCGRHYVQEEQNRFVD